MISRSVSGEGQSLKAAMIHCSLGMTTSRARIAAPISQFTTMRIRSAAYAIGSAADDEAGLDTISTSRIYRLTINTLSNFVKRLLSVDKARRFLIVVTMRPETAS